MKIQFCDLAEQQKRIRADVDRRIARVLDHGKYILGPEVDELEERLAHFVGVRHCITCANGTDALQIAQMALGIGPGDEVITPGFSYIATAEASKVIGASPVYADICPDTYNLDPLKVPDLINERTRAIIPVSLYGQCADFDEINRVAASNGLPVIEDAAQSLGALYRGRRSGSVSTVACTSFFPSKPLGCYGDGGAIFTDDDELAITLRQIARHGQARRYYHVRVGVNSRLDTLQATILLAKMDVFVEELDLRQQVADNYAELLGTSKQLVLPHVREGNRSVWAQYTVRVNDRDAVIKKLGDAGIPTAIHYPLPLNRQPAVSSDQSLAAGDLAADEVLSLPMHPYLSKADQRLICDALLDAVS